MLQNPALGAAPPAWPARGHQEPPVTPWCLKADTPPASGGDPGQEAAHRWNVQPQMPRAGPEDDAGAATHQKTVLGAAAAPDLPGGRHRGPPVDPQGLGGDDAPASRGWPGQEAAPRYNIRPQIPRGRPKDGVGADVLQPPVLRAAAAAALKAKRHWGPPAIPRCLNAAAAPATPGQSGCEAAPGYNIGPQIPTAGLNNATGAAVLQPHVLAPVPSRHHNKACCQSHLC